MSDPGRGDPQSWAEGGPERLYVVTGGRDRPREPIYFDLVTLIVSRHDPKPGTQPEQAAILRMCGRPLSIAEISAYLALPTSTISVLVADLVEGGQADIRRP